MQQGVVNSVVVYTRRDIVWAVSSVYLCIALMYRSQDKPGEILVSGAEPVVRRSLCA